MNYQQRITLESGKRGGKPCIHGLRMIIGNVGYVDGCWGAALRRPAQAATSTFHELPEKERVLYFLSPTAQN